MTGTELLTKIKQGMGITGNYQDETLQVYIDEVKLYMHDAGVPQEVIDSPAAVGVILRGVIDWWNYESGGAGPSAYFKERVIQLAATPVATGGESDV